MALGWVGLFSFSNKELGGAGLVFWEQGGVRSLRFSLFIFKTVSYPGTFLCPLCFEAPKGLVFASGTVVIWLLWGWVCGDRARASSGCPACVQQTSLLPPLASPWWRCWGARGSRVDQFLVSVFLRWLPVVAACVLLLVISSIHCVFKNVAEFLVPQF